MHKLACSTSILTLSFRSECQTSPGVDHGAALTGQMIWSLEKVDELTDRQIVGQHQQAGNTLIGQFMLSLQIRHLFPEKIGTVLPNTHLRPISRSDRSGNRFFTGGQAHPATPQFSCQHHTHIYSCTARKGGTSCHGFFLQDFTYQLISTSENT